MIMRLGKKVVVICIILLLSVSACITVYVQKDNTNSSINTSDTSENSADSASIDVSIPSEAFE